MLMGKKESIGEIFLIQWDGSDDILSEYLFFGS